MSRSRRLGVILLAVLLVAQVAVAPVAAATSTTSTSTSTVEDCDDGGLPDAFDAAVSAATLGLVGTQESCVEEVKAIAEQERRNELWNKRITALENSKYLNDVLYENYVHDSRRVADAAVRAEVADQFSQGVSKSVAYDAAYAEAEDYYSRMQMNYLERWNAHIAQLEGDMKVMKNDTRLNLSFNTYDGTDGIAYTDASVYNTDRGDTTDEYRYNLTFNGNFATRTATLVNGSTVNYTVPQFHSWILKKGANPYVAVNETAYIDPVRGQQTTSLNSIETLTYEGNIMWRWHRQDGVTETREVFDLTRWNNTWKSIESAEMLVQSKFNETFEPIWLNLQEGNLDPERLISPWEAIDRTANTGDGNLSPRVLGLYEAGFLGLEGVNISVSQRQVVRVQGYTGTPPLAEQRVEVSNASGTPTELTTSHNLTWANNSVLHVRVWYDDGTYQTVPRDRWEIADTDDTAVSVLSWSDEQLANKSIVNTTATVLVDHDPTATVYVNRTIEGSFFTAAQPNGTTIQIGQTYQTGQLPGLQAVVDMNGSTHYLNGRVTVVAAYDRDNQPVDTLVFDEHDYATYSSDDYQQQIDRYTTFQKMLNEEEEDIDSSDSGGGGGDSSTTCELGPLCGLTLDGILSQLGLAGLTSALPGWLPSGPAGLAVAGVAGLVVVGAAWKLLSGVIPLL